jgi:ADP-ribose pyrophosphatase YjhB (NUDIX family)
MNYVICYAHPHWEVYPTDILLIRKNRPDWQAGRYNLPGGKIEDGETIHEAASRELFEETNIKAHHVRIIGTIEADNCIVYVCECTFDANEEAATMTDEMVFWMDVGDALRDPLLLDSLRVAIPFCFTQLSCWHIRQQTERFSTATSSQITFEEVHAKIDVPKSFFFGPVG